ncbi:MAG: phenylalanine--tRNA ligase subunit alpha [Candidatus Aenigmarchaeota archaeon]|nr:phenylalanine--tRNA ligase subunit alpha [Candidatus Aenigmarchaeota archaeon]
MSNMNYRLTKEGKEYLKHGLPEIQLVRALEIKKTLKIEEAKRLINNFSIAIQWAKKYGWVDVRGEDVVLSNISVKSLEEEGLHSIDNSQDIEDDLVKLLIQRRLIEEAKEDVKTRAEKFIGKEVGTLTPELIGTGVWRDVKLKEYNVEIIGQKLHVGKRQPYGAFLDWVKEKMVGLGFEEKQGPIVETEFWNMDALYMPQHHSARDIHDAYFVKDPKYAKALDKNILNAVKNAHEKGTKESRGWEYQYNVQRAHRLILRTHDTAISPRTLSSQNLKVPGKYFQISRCFRYDVVDATHLPDFYQMGGFVVDKGLNLKHLIGLLKLFAKEFANTDEVKVMPSYFPFTEPSAQLMAKHPDFGWLELAGAGIFRHEMCEPLGVKDPVIAWGAGLDRIFMMSMGIKDIRDLFSYDLKFLRNSKVVY